MRTRSDHDHARTSLPQAMWFGIALIALGAAVELARHVAAPEHTVSHHASFGGVIVLSGMLVTVGGIIAQAFGRGPHGPERRD